MSESTAYQAEDEGYTGPGREIEDPSCAEEPPFRPETPPPPILTVQTLAEATRAVNDQRRGWRPPLARIFMLNPGTGGTRPPGIFGLPPELSQEVYAEIINHENAVSPYTLYDPDLEETRISLLNTWISPLVQVSEETAADYMWHYARMNHFGLDVQLESYNDYEWDYRWPANYFSVGQFNWLRSLPGARNVRFRNLQFRIGTIMYSSRRVALTVVYNPRKRAYSVSYRAAEVFIDGPWRDNLTVLKRVNARVETFMAILARICASSRDEILSWDVAKILFDALDEEPLWLSEMPNESWTIDISLQPLQSTSERH